MSDKVYANNLRIGNLLQQWYVNRTEIFEVKSINESFINDTISIDDCWPITLTPEILEKCGFERGEEPGVFTLDGKIHTFQGYSIGTIFYVYQAKKGFHLSRTFDKNDAYRLPVFYLHQLQNVCQVLGFQDFNVTSFLDNSNKSTSNDSEDVE